MSFWNTLNIDPSLMRVRCLDCGWSGLGRDLWAEACPFCDGLCAEEGSPEYEVAKYYPMSPESVARARAAQLAERAWVEQLTGLKIAKDGTISR